MKKNITIFFFFSFLSTLFAQNELLQSGPMVGYSQMREVLLWVQTKKQAEVQFVYWDKNNSSNKFKTEKYTTSKEEAFTAKLVAEELEPGLAYEYQVIINGEEVNRDYRTEFMTQKLWQYREDPPEFSFAIGSCAFINEAPYDRPGEPYGGEYQIFEFIYEKDPDFFVWMGDNYYLREVDWHSRSGILKRITHTRSTPEMQPMLGSMHHYATWDDHDYGPNNSDRSFWAKHFTTEAFELFWGNPSYGVNGAEEGITTFFQWSDCEFFMMDDRYYRTPENRKFTKREMLGEGQIEWLIDALCASDAPFKFIVIGSTVLNPIAVGENYENFPEEKAKLLRAIEKEGIEGVIFLTGDIHRSELSKLTRWGNYPLYEFTISPLTAGVSSYEGPNPIRVEGTLTMDRAFAYFEVTGPRKDRTLKCTVYDSDGSELWNYSINENELKVK